ncbi:MAG: hypothetical protein Q4A15_12690 [Prevotellaceae bacterium]|nr:hypothetical protein [Prevotellaceae bacterium]
MKKVLLVLAAVAMLGFASCSKEKTCVCSYDIEIFGVNTNVPLGEKVTTGSCSDLENAGAWNLNIGNLAGAKFHCEKK